MSPNIDTLLQAEVEAIESGLWSRLVGEVQTDLGTDSKVIVARYVMRFLREEGSLLRLTVLTEIVRHISAWADRHTVTRDRG